jgi:hypothetical protein
MPTPDVFVTGGFGGFVFIYWGAILVVHAFFAIAVYKDATRLENSSEKKLVLVGPVIWAMATFVTGVVGALGYWVLHHTLPQLLGSRDDGPKPS